LVHGFQPSNLTGSADAPVLEAHLSYGEVPIDQSSVSDPTKHLNPRHAINQLFDPQNDRLPLLLFNPGGGEPSDSLLAIFARLSVIRIRNRIAEARRVTRGSLDMEPWH